MGKRLLVIGLFTLFLTACYDHRILTKEDYIRMSDDEIRNVLFKYTPLGMKEDEVARIVLDRLNRKLQKGYYYNTEDSAGKSTQFRGNVTVGDYYLYADLMHYGWVRHFFLAGEIVSASWLFSKTGILKDIRVVHHSDGV